MDTKKLNIYQLNDGYCYNSDTLFLYSFVKNFLANNISVLDIGAGSGILGLLCARDYNINLTLNEIDETMAKICHKNAVTNNIKCNILQGDILLINDINKQDLIISNPPFYRKDSINPKSRYLYLAKKSENMPLESLCHFAKKTLKPNAKFIFCYSAKEIQKIFNAIHKCKLSIDAIQFVYPKENKNANLVMLSCGSSNNNCTQILPPLFNFNGQEYSNETKNIFTMCNTFSIKINEEEI